MHAFVELWTAKPTWLALSAEQRQAFMDTVGASMGELAAAGIETLGWGYNQPDTDRRVGYEVFAVWTMPGAQELALMQRTVAASGWYDYFDHVNAAGPLQDPPSVIADHIRM